MVETFEARIHKIALMRSAFERQFGFCLITYHNYQGPPGFTPAGHDGFKPIPLSKAHLIFIDEFMGDGTQKEAPTDPKGALL